jgi:hypothetical protein
MCSGCSGQFDGEDERDDQELIGEDAWCVGSYAARDSRRVGGMAFENDRGIIEAADEYEVLVSGERIIERRILQAKWLGFNEEGAIKSARQRDRNGAWRERDTPTSAKYYRTFRWSRKSRADHDWIFHKCLVWGSLGAVLLAAMALWLGAR